MMCGYARVVSRTVGSDVLVSDISHTNHRYDVNHHPKRLLDVVVARHDISTVSSVLQPAKGVRRRALEACQVFAIY